MIPVQAIAWALVLVAALPAQSEGVPVDDHATEVAADAARVAEVQGQLATNDLAVVARGADTAAEHRLRATIPALRTALAQQRAQETEEQKLCALAVLDALVRTRADVPPDELTPFLETCTSTVLVLLAQDPERGAGLLLDFFTARGRGDEHQSVDWLAAGGLLLRVRAPGFAPAIVRYLHLDLAVCVWDPQCVGGHMKGGGTFDGTVFRRNRVFPINHYVLTEGGGSHSTLLVDDPCPVSWRRRVIPVGVTRRTTTGEMRDAQDQARIAWLEVLAGMPAGALALAASTTLSIEWKDARDFEGRVAQAREAIETRWRGLRAELERRGLLEAKSALGSAPFVRVIVHDHREERAPALPEVRDAEMVPRAQPREAGR